MKSHLPAAAIASAVAAAKSAGLLTAAEMKFPASERRINDKAKLDNWMYQDVPAKGGKTGTRREYLLAAIPGLPAAVKQALGISGATAAAQAATEIRTEQRLNIEEKRKIREEGLVFYNQLPPEKQQSAEAKKLVLDACEAFLKSGGWSGRCRDGQDTWSKKGVDTFCLVIVTDGNKILPGWVMACLVRKGQTSLGYRTIIRWREAFETAGMWGLADKYDGHAGSTSIPPDQLEFLAALRVQHPHISSTKVMSALEARFAPPLPSYFAVIVGLFIMSPLFHAPVP